ncbi:MerR family transcriptional regulator [Pseudomonas paraversuta]|uniref:MerR family transcriptional regulator n=1 Tax=Pseudomonas TaxID=286 RepID=UPI000FC38EA6|nr:MULTISPECIES: MerR family transcriptional regulator [unclassified Pseudomonas]MCH4870494.1 MerR family transcriptional regulator [Pseudomonas sp. TMW22089]NNG61900.1 MerR family transcriptional regulator [Pseudomonas sp. GC01]RUT39170.1 MerR family transcriptional regulator [Pseudomonas sp. PAMC 29040]
MNQDLSQTSSAAPDYNQALAEGWLPIREVARITGVNAVTLRAWERRYGLIVPHRTAKGHRLFSAAHIQRIQHILTWLNRGVSVSQVKPLLDLAPSHREPVDNDWLAWSQALTLAITELAGRRLDDNFNQVMSLYPAHTLCEQLLIPLLSELEQRWQGQFGAQLERVFFSSWLRSKLGARIYHNNRSLKGKPILLINHSPQPFEAQLWLTAWLVSSSHCPVEVFDAPLPGGELALAVERLKSPAVVLYSSQTLNPQQLPKLLKGVDCPILIAGPTVCIHSAELAVSTTEIAGLSLARDPLEAHQRLSQLGLF